MSKVAYSLKWAGIASTLIVFVDILGVVIFLLVGEGWNSLIFLHLLLECLMLEGLAMALLGCMSFFGFEKYRELLGGKVTSRGGRTKKAQPVDKKESKPNWGLFLIALGILLFFVAFAFFALIFP